MIAIKRYPAQLNGYTIAAVCARVQQRTNNFNEDEAVILGFDLTRRHGKFVTAYMALKTEDGEPPTEWFIGHYFEYLDRAMKDFLRRSALEYHEIPPSITRQNPEIQSYPIVKAKPEDIWRALGEGI